MTDYPSTLPGPQIAEYGVSNLFGLSSVRFDRGNKRQRRGSKRDRIVFSLSFVLTTQELWVWQSWANASGYDWHTMDLESAWSGLAASGETLIPHTVRYISDISIQPLGAGYHRVMVQAEMDVNTLPQGVVVQTGNWYVARTPSNPATDRIIAGSPSSPSTDVIIAGTPSLPAA